ncbi:MAG: hypothetical protein IT304_04635 [Dehalococcoidia bacterium]|nr:hypothetical protein [Dehalococcoidia bacterium]
MGIDGRKLTWRPVARAGVGVAAIVAAVVVIAGPSGGSQGVKANGPAPGDRCADVSRLLDRVGAGREGAALDVAAKERSRREIVQGRAWVDSGCRPDGEPGPLLAALLFGVPDGAEGGATAQAPTACVLLAQRLAAVEAALSTSPQAPPQPNRPDVAQGRGWAAGGCDPGQEPGNLAGALAVWVPLQGTRAATDDTVVQIALP